MSRLKIFTLTILSAIIIVTGFFVIKRYLKDAPYLSESGYYKESGLNFGYFSDIIKKYGEPEKMATDENGLLLAIYNDFQLHLMGGTIENSGVQVITITSPKCRLGKDKIGVGSSKNDIIKAYSRAGQYTFITYNEKTNVCNAADKGMQLNFYLDAEGTVTKFDFYWQGDYWTISP